jgi:hypothetical protein
MSIVCARARCVASATAAGLSFAGCRPDPQLVDRLELIERHSWDLGRASGIRGVAGDTSMGFAVWSASEVYLIEQPNGRGASTRVPLGIEARIVGVGVASPGSFDVLFSSGQHLRMSSRGELREQSRAVPGLRIFAATLLGDTWIVAGRDSANDLFVHTLGDSASRRTVRLTSPSYGSPASLGRNSLAETS